MIDQVSQNEPPVYECAPDCTWDEKEPEPEPTPMLSPALLEKIILNSAYAQSLEKQIEHDSDTECPVDIHNDPWVHF